MEIRGHYLEVCRCFMETNDDEERFSCYQMLAAWKSDIENLTYFFEVITSTNDVAARLFALISIQFHIQTNWNNFDQSTRIGIKQLLLDLIHNDNENLKSPYMIRAFICLADMIAIDPREYLDLLIEEMPITLQYWVFFYLIEELQCPFLVKVYQKNVVEIDNIQNEIFPKVVDILNHLEPSEDFLQLLIRSFTCTPNFHNLISFLPKIGECYQNPLLDPLLSDMIYSVLSTRFVSIDNEDTVFFKEIMALAGCVAKRAFESEDYTMACQNWSIIFGFSSVILQDPIYYNEYGMSALIQEFFNESWSIPPDFNDFFEILSQLADFFIDNEIEEIRTTYLMNLLQLLLNISNTTYHHLIDNSLSSLHAAKDPYYAQQILGYFYQCLLENPIPGIFPALCRFKPIPNELLDLACQKAIELHDQIPPFLLSIFICKLGIEKTEYLPQWIDLLFSFSMILPKKILPGLVTILSARKENLHSLVNERHVQIIQKIIQDNSPYTIVNATKIYLLLAPNDVEFLLGHISSTLVDIIYRILGMNDDSYVELFFENLRCSIEMLSPFDEYANQIYNVVIQSISTNVNEHTNIQMINIMLHRLLKFPGLIICCDTDFINIIIQLLSSDEFLSIVYATLWVSRIYAGEQVYPPKICDAITNALEKLCSQVTDQARFENCCKYLVILYDCATKTEENYKFLHNLLGSFVQLSQHFYEGYPGIIIQNWLGFLCWNCVVHNWLSIDKCISSVVLKHLALQSSQYLETFWDDVPIDLLKQIITNSRDIDISINSIGLEMNAFDLISTIIKTQQSSADILISLYDLLSQAFFHFVPSDFLEPCFNVIQQILSILNDGAIDIQLPMKRIKHTIEENINEQDMRVSNMINLMFTIVDAAIAHETIENYMLFQLEKTYQTDMFFSDNE